MRSDGYSTGDIKYEFINGKKGVTQDSFEMPQFGLMDLGVKSKKVTLSSGTYSRLGILFLFKRSIGFYIIQVYLPAALIVIISYVSFWVPRNSVPARISLGVTTVLTITTLTVTTSASNVKISYVKALDCYLGFCFLMVFSSLIEYAIVGYIGKRHSSDEKEKAIKEAVAAASKASITSIVNPPQMLPNVTQRPSYMYNHPSYKPFYSSSDRNSNLYDGNRYPSDYPCLCQQLSPPTSHQLQILVHPKSRESAPEFRSSQANISIPKFVNTTPSSIDKMSRILFPCVFIIFNLGYWSYLMNISVSEISEADLA